MRKMMFFATVVIGVLLSSVSLGYSGGAGTAESPYQIADANDLFELSADTGNYDKCFILTADIDLAGQTFSTAIIAPGSINSSTGAFLGTSFTGTFDGNGHKITNFTINSTINSECIGLFGGIGSGGQIKSLGIENHTVIGYRRAGALAGCNWGNISLCYSTGAVYGAYYVGGLVGDSWEGSISNCYSTGDVSGASDVGGLVGSNACRVDDCYSAGSVSGTENVGGLIGSGGNGNPSGTCDITNCYTTGDVSGDNNVGGLIGDNYYSGIRNCNSTGSISGYNAGGLIGSNVGGTISLCYSTGNVIDGWYIGGLIGGNSDGKISQCYAAGIVSGSSDSWYVGGLVGYNMNSSLYGCYATGNVSGKSSVGGLVGGAENRGTVNNCYATGNVTGSDYFAGGLAGWNVGDIRYCYCYATGLVSGVNYVGGLMGSGSADNSFWDTQTSGQTTSAGGEGKTTAEMKTLSTFTLAEWNFTSVWGMALGQYPELFIRQAGDLNLDARVDMSDLMILSQHWLEDK